MKLELVIFDWDGTLMDSAARIVNCVTAAFEEQGLAPPTPAAARQVIGLGLDEAMQALWPEGDAARRAELAQRYRRRFLGADPTPMPLFAGAETVLKALRERALLLAVATGKSRRGLDMVLAETGLGNYFHATRCADESFSKPHPGMLLELLDELGVAADAALMVGDTVFDLDMARNAGVAALAVCYGVHAPKRLLECAPLGCLDALTDLPAWLAKHKMI